MKVQVGDWVRFYKGAGLVVAVVAYVEEFPSDYVLTDIGAIKRGEILEVRRKNENPNP